MAVGGQEDLRAGRATANLIIKAKQQQPAQQQPPPPPQQQHRQQQQQLAARKQFELRAAENDHNYTLARPGASERMDDCTAAMVLMFLSCRPGEEGAREPLSFEAGEPKNAFAKRVAEQRQQQSACVGGGQDQLERRRSLSGNIGSATGAAAARCTDDSSNNNNSNHHHRHHHHHRHNDQQLQQLAPTRVPNSRPAIVLNDKEEEAGAGVNSRPTHSSKPNGPLQSSAAAKAEINMKRNSKPIEMPQQDQRHSKRPLDADEQHAEPRSRFKFAVQPGVPGKRRSSYAGENDAGEENDDDDELELAFVESAPPKPEDEMIFELQQVDQVGESQGADPAPSRSTKSKEAPEASGVSHEQATAAMDWNGCNGADSSERSWPLESHRPKKARVAPAGLRLELGEAREASEAAFNSDKQIRANNLGDLTGAELEGADGAEIEIEAGEGPLGAAQEPPSPPPIDEDKLRASFQRQLAQRQPECADCDEEEDEHDENEGNHPLRFGPAKHQQQLQAQQQQQQQVQLQSTKMRTIFSCMWPSCSVNCDSLEDIERHVRAHLGCKQYESIGDEDFYYEETEVDEPTYLAIFDHPLTSRQRHHGCHPAGESGGQSRRNVARPQSPSHNSDGLSSGQSFASSSPATSPVCSDSSPPSSASSSSSPSSASSSSSLSYHAHHYHAHHAHNHVFGGGGGAAADGSVANSIDWNQFLSSSSLVALEQQQQRKQATPNSKRNNSNKWPSSSSNQHQQKQQVYLMNGIGPQAGGGSPFMAVCDFADQAKAQPTICDATIFMQQHSAYALARGAGGAGKRRQRGQQLDGSNLNHRNNRTKSSAKRNHHGSRQLDSCNQRNLNQIATSLQFSMQLNGGQQASPGYGTRGAIYAPTGEAQHKQKRANGQRGLANGCAEGERPSALDHSYLANHGEVCGGEQLELKPPARRGRRPKQATPKAAAAAAAAARASGRGRRNSTTTTTMTTTAIDQQQQPNHHDQHIFHLKQHQSSGKSLASKTITRTSAPSNTPTTHAKFNTNSSPALVGSAVPLNVAAASDDDDDDDDDDDSGRHTDDAIRQVGRGDSSPSSPTGLPAPAFAALHKPAGGLRRVRGENRKCRKVYGMERRDQWCTQCKWKKACTRFSLGDGKLLLPAIGCSNNS